MLLPSCVTMNDGWFTLVGGRLSHLSVSKGLVRNAMAHEPLCRLPWRPFRDRPQCLRGTYAGPTPHDQV
jgi:hypothetical protein